MNKLLPIIIAAFLFSGCGASQRDLVQVRTELRAEIQSTANSRALAVHECALSQFNAVQAEAFCTNAPGTVACQYAQLWQSYCLMTVPRDGVRVLTNPRPGVDTALRLFVELVNQQQVSSDSQ